MPIKGLESVIRIPRTFNVRLGVRMKRMPNGQQAQQLKVRSEDRGYPSETEYFVLDVDEVPEEIRKLYGTEPKALRLMLMTEYDMTDQYGHEMTLNLNNRAWRRRGLHCFGHGRAADEADVAYTNDEAWALRISQAAKMSAELVTGEERKAAPMPGDKVWRIPCLGQDCPKYSRLVEGFKDGQKAMVQAEGHDEDAGCKANICLRAWLLHPDFGRKDMPGEREILAAIQIASGSYNTIVQLRSGFRMMRNITQGRTAFIPFTLVRKPTQTFTPMRQTHWTLDVKQAPSEWARYAAIAPHLMFMSPAEYAYARQLAEEPLGVDYDTVKDLYPTAERKALEAPQPPLPTAGTVSGDVASPTPGAAPLTGESPTESPADASAINAEDDVFLTRSEVDELRRCFGTRRDPEGPEDDNQNPYPAEVLAKLIAAVKLYDDQHHTTTSKFSQLTRKHYKFIKRIAVGQPQGEGNAR